MARKSTSTKSRKSTSRTRTSSSSGNNTSGNTSRSTNNSRGRSTSSTSTTTPFGTPSFDSMFKGFPQTAANFGFSPNATNFGSAFNSPFNMDQVKDQMARLGMLSNYNNYNNATRANKDTVDAAIKSSQALAKAAEELGKAIYSFTQSSMELGAQAGQAILNVRTLKDLVDVQTEYARNSMDHLISGTSRISDMAVKIANEVMDPINQRVNDAVEKMSKAA